MANLTKDEMTYYGLITNVDVAASELPADNMLIKTRVVDVDAYEVIYEETSSDEESTPEQTTDPVEPNNED